MCEELYKIKFVVEFHDAKDLKERDYILNRIDDLIKSLNWYLGDLSK